MSDETSQEFKDYSNFAWPFYPAFAALTLPAEAACESMGNYNTAWEIQDELISWSYLIDSEWLDFGTDLREELKRLIDGLRALPSEAIQPKRASQYSREGSIIAMSHPTWEPLRQQAASLLPRLEPVWERSQAFLHPG